LALRRADIGSIAVTGHHLRLVSRAAIVLLQKTYAIVSPGDLYSLSLREGVRGRGFICLEIPLNRASGAVVGGTEREAWNGVDIRRAGIASPLRR
jgi:hypothetical protein